MPLKIVRKGERKKKESERQRHTEVERKTDRLKLHFDGNLKGQSVNWN